MATVAPQISPFSFGEDEALNAGDFVVVQCSAAKGDSPLSLRWSFQSMPLASDGPFSGLTINNLGERISVLSIQSVAAVHNGDYTCTAENPAGIANYSATLTVNGIRFDSDVIFSQVSHLVPRSASPRLSTIVNYLYEQFPVVPRIVPFDISSEGITSGQPVTIQCTITEGDLPVQFRWSFHGEELSSQLGVSTVRLNSRVSLLSIDSVVAEHAGDYTCTAQNSAGSVNYTATLLVQGSN